MPLTDALEEAKAAQTAGPTRAVAAAAAKATVTHIAVRAHQYPPAMSASGTSTAICGLKHSAPNKMPATLGWVSSNNSPLPSNAVDNGPFWPLGRLAKSAGLASATSAVSGRGRIRRMQATYAATV